MVRSKLKSVHMAKCQRVLVLAICLVAVSRGMRAVNLYSSKILQLLTLGAS